MKINAICPGGVHTAIVPDELREIISMSPDVMAAEVIDLLLTGSNGETRVKLAADLPARAIPAPEL